jgi:ribosomal protein S18 acetylase RimI-like enzyme
MRVGMAAATEAHAPDVVDLRRIRARDLNPLLEAEIKEWQARLHWDFRPSADLVRRFVAMQSLAGHALVLGGAVTGYTYLVSDEGKGLIGDLYLMEPHHTWENEARLLEAGLRDLFEVMLVRRVESQLMLLRSSGRRPLPYADMLRVHPRGFMMMDASRSFALRPGPASGKALIEAWGVRRMDEAAEVIASAYQGHVDGDVNDQYRSVPGARRFLNNLIQYPGCGAFFQPASYVAIDAWTGRACGISLTSMLSPGVGHITQICVVPTLKGKGLGYELLRRSLLALAEAGFRKASLTVTLANREAVRLYQRVGFETAHAFSALVWDKDGRAGR